MTKFKAVTHVTYQYHSTIESVFDTEGVVNAVAIGRARARQVAHEIAKGELYTANTFVLGDTTVEKVEDVPE